MRLRDLLCYDNICIQCHDNPDADALASGYGLYIYYKSQGKDVRLIYSGRNSIAKSNLLLMLEKLDIPVEYISEAEAADMYVDGLLITVDCQYSSGNVTRIGAKDVAVIDHHRTEVGSISKSVIRPDLGSCATLIWRMLLDEGVDVDNNIKLSTALFYGLYTDTNQFSELYNPIDRDARDSIIHDKTLITLFKNSNITLQELEVAGVALLRHSYNVDYRFAIIKAQPCDPNILGLISDFLLQVDGVDTCLVYNETPDGFKISIRSCIREVNASELAEYITENIGSGGGHYTKAGGFVNKAIFAQKYPLHHSEAYFNARMVDYFDQFELIWADEYEVNGADLQPYVKKSLPIGFAMPKDFLEIGTPITVRTLEGDIDMTVEEDTVILIGIKGEVYPNNLEKFKRSYEILDKKYEYDKYVIDNDYIPMIKDRYTGENLLVSDYAGVCMPTGETKILAKQISSHVKVFTNWDRDKYMLGRPGDYLVARCDDLHDIYIVEQKIFSMTYSKCSD